MYRRQLLQVVSCTVPAIASPATVVSAESAEYEPLGSAPVSDATEAVVGPEAETAYVAIQDGFAIVDISTPESPTVVERRTGLLAEHEGGPIQEILDVKVADNRLLVAGPANHQDDPSLEGFLLYDVSNPHAPERIAFYETGFPIHNAFLTDEYAYLVDSSRVIVIELAGTPQEVGTWQPRDADPDWADVHPLIRFAHDLYVQDDRAYVVEWDAGTFVLDVSDPENPVAISRIGGRTPEALTSISEDDVLNHSLGMPGNHHTVMVNEDASLLVLNKEAWKTELTEREGVAPLGKVELWDISDERAPEKYATIDAPPSRAPTKAEINTTPHNFDIVDDRLYTSWYDGGVKIHDISDPETPELLAWWRAPEQWTFWTAQYATDEFFIASSHTRGQYNRGKGAVVTFPNRPGEQSSPPPLTTPTPQLTPSPTETPMTTPTATQTRTPRSTDATATQTETGAADGPGFGVLAALGAIALGAWKRRADE